jgi:hypothetical protein
MLKINININKILQNINYLIIIITLLSIKVKSVFIYKFVNKHFIFRNLYFKFIFIKL